MRLLSEGAACVKSSEEQPWVTTRLRSAPTNAATVGGERRAQQGEQATRAHLGTPAGAVVRLAEDVHGVAHAAALATEAHVLMPWPLRTPTTSYQHPSQQPRGGTAINTPQSASARSRGSHDRCTRQPVWGEQQSGLVAAA